MKTLNPECRRAGGHRSSLMSALIASLLAAATIAPATAQPATQAPVLVPVPGPAAKPALEDARFADSAVQAKVVRGSDRLSLAIQATADSTARAVELGEAVQRVLAIHRFEGKLIVLGRLADGGATEVSIVDFTNGRLVDRFWGYDPAVSPDASMVAFVRFYPLHFTEGVESQYRLYRLRGTPEANRSFYKGQQAGTGHEHADTKGAKGQAPRANIGVADAQAHTHLSRLVWSADSSRVGVIDAHGKSVKALVMPVAGDAEATPIAQSIDGLDAVCLPARSEDCESLPFDAVSLGFDAKGEALRLKITDKSLFPKGFAKTLPLKAFAAQP
jgi:hypothetical protein